MDQRMLRDTPVAVIDFETTGLSVDGGARVVEVAVVRIEPGQAPQVVLDTLIDPEGPVLCTSIHGISDDDVLGAPRFTEILGELVLSLEGAVVGAFNASFDMAFLSAEAKLARRTAALRLPPHVCFMWMRPLVGLSKRCSLDVACQQHGLKSVSHRAAEDALACAHMWQHYLDAAEKSGWRTWADLSRAGSHKYLRTLTSSPYTRGDYQAVGGAPCGTAKKPRRQPIVPPNGEFSPEKRPVSRVEAGRTYWKALVDALVDDHIDKSEVEGLRQLQRDVGLTVNAMRDAHARLFADCLRVCVEDRTVSDEEASKLRSLRQALEELGWAPG